MCNNCVVTVLQAGIPFTSTYSAKLDAYLAKNAAERKRLKESKQQDGKSGGSEGLHAYSPEDYGLTAAQIQAEFADYIAKYDL